MVSGITFIYWPEEIDVLENCLKSLAFCDEIIIIDNGAPKETIDIAKKYTKNIYPDAPTSFASHHNLGKDKAKGDWILYVDSDERVSQKLANEIKSVSNDFDAYQIKRINFFLGKEVKYGDRVPDYVTRLFKKEKLNNWVGDIHESSQVDGKVSQLKSPLYHLTHRDIFSMVAKTINFSEHEANLRLAAHHPPIVWWRLVRVFLTEFWSRIVKMQGFRQGTEGWIDGILQAFSLFIVYARLWEKQRREPLAKTYEEIDQKILNGQL